MEQGLGDLESASHAAAEGVDVVASAVGEVEAFEPVIDAFLKVCAAEAVEAGVVPQVFFSGEFAVEAGVLKDDAELLADAAGMLAE